MKIQGVVMVLLALSSTGCLGAADETSSTVQAEWDTGLFKFRSVKLTFSDSTPFATVYLFNKPLGGFQTNLEYWYVNLASLNRLGVKPINALTTDFATSTPPSDPGFANEQAFTLPLATNWGSAWSVDPLSGGYLYRSANNQGLRVTLGSNPTRVSVLGWYQSLPNGTAPANVTPAGTFNVSGSSFTVPTGSSGYDISMNVP